MRKVDQHLILHRTGYSTTQTKKIITFQKKKIINFELENIILKMEKNKNLQDWLIKK